MVPHMGTRNAQAIISLEESDTSPFLAAARTTAYRTMTVRVTGADRQHTHTQVLSAGLSALEIPLAPMGVSAPEPVLFLFQADQEVDLALGASATLLSGVQFLLLTGVVSAAYLHTGSQTTTILTNVIGGSAAAVIVSRPIP